MSLSIYYSIYLLYLLSQREASECPTGCILILIISRADFNLCSHGTKILTVWYKKKDSLEIAQCDHLHALPYFSETIVHRGKQCSFMTFRLKIFLIM